MTEGPKSRKVRAGTWFQATTVYPPPIALKEPEPRVRFPLRVRLGALVVFVGALCGAGAWIVERITR